MTKVALVTGSTGLVGNALTERLLAATRGAGAAADGEPWKVYGVGSRLKPDWHKPSSYIQCNLREKSDTIAKLGPLTDVTHIFHLACVTLGSYADEEQCEKNGAILGNVLDAILPNAKNMQHVCVQTGCAHYLMSSGTSESTEFPDHPFQEDVPRLPGISVSHTLEDVLKKAVASTQGRVSWSVHRPSVIFGSSCRSHCNFIATISIYATVCKYENLPLIWPGAQGAAWDSVHDASDADLQAEQQIWAATNPNGQNQAFNCTNGDLFTWKRLWKLVAEKFQIEAVPPTYPPFDWNEMMRDKQEVWDQIVKKHSLQPINIHEVGQFRMMAAYMSADGSKMVLSTNKSKELGFLGCRNTEKSFLSCIETLREYKIIP